MFVICFLCVILSCLSIANGFEVLISSNQTSDNQTHLKRLFLSTQQINIRVTLTPSNNSEADDDTFIEGTVLPPTILLSNSSWSQQVALYKIQNDSVNAWSFALIREDFGIDTSWSLREIWVMTASFQHPTQGKLQAETTIIDLETVPLLQWTFGDHFDAVVPPGTEFMQSPLLATDPCTPEAAIVVVQSNTQPEMIYIGVTSSAFTQDLHWNNMTTSSLCPTCESLEIWDVAVTNHHVIFLTNHGIFVSGDLRVNKNVNQSAMLMFNESYEAVIRGGERNTFEFTWTYQHQSSKMGRIEYTPVCMFYQYSLFRGDIVSVTVITEDKEQMSIYAVEPFKTWWEVPAMASGSVLSTAYNYHTHSLASLVTDQLNQSKVIVNRLKPNNRPHDKLYFPAWQFPAEAGLQRLVYLPQIYILYAVGTQIWMSQDNGNKFEKIHDLDPDVVATTPTDIKKGIIVMTTNNSDIYISKLGAPRLVKMQTVVTPGEQEWLSFDHNSQLLQSQLSIVESNELSTLSYNITYIDLNAEIQNYSRSCARPLCLQYISSQEAYVFEYSPLDGSTPWLHPFHEGQLLKTTAGGSALILKVNPAGKFALNGFLTRTRLEIHESFKFESSTVNQQCSLDMLNWNKTNGHAQLVLNIPGGESGWSEADVGKTVIIPGATSFLLIGYVSATHMDAVSPVYSSVQDGTTINPGFWFLLDMGVRDNQAQWTIVEDACHQELVLNPMTQDKSVFELDIRDSVSISAQMNSLDNMLALQVPRLYGSLSNPWQFKTIFELSESTLESRYTLDISLTNHVFRQGVTSVRITQRYTSMLCDASSRNILIYSNCPCRKMLEFIYPSYISPDEFLYGMPRNNRDIRLVVNLDTNYRPGSVMGKDIPTSKHIYNSDPTMPMPNNKYKISRETGKYKQCLNKTSRVDCGCEEWMKLSSDPLYTDCRGRSYRLVYPGRLEPQFAWVQPNMPDIPLTVEHLVAIEEINQRAPRINENTESILSEGVKTDPLLEYLTDTYFNPTAILLSMNGSGLYHYKAVMLPGQSFCDLKTYFMVYVDLAPIAYPLNYVLQFGTSIIIGIILLVAYLWYLTNHHHHRVRRVGPLCLEKHEMIHIKGDYKFNQTQKEQPEKS